MDISSLFFYISNELKIVEKQLSDCVNIEHPSLRQNFQNLLQAGGKRIRPAFVLLAGKVYDQNPNDKLIAVAAAVELVHMSTLIHDDIIDRSEVRRGQPTIRSVKGNKFALHAGDYLFTQAIQLVRPEDNKEITKLLSKVSVEMCKGEIIQLISTFDYNQTVRDYLYKIKRKTALLIAISCQMGGMITNAPQEAIKALYNYGYNLGMAFQIKDDVLDFIGEEDAIGKPVGSDLWQGVLTLPIILTLKESNPSAQRLKNLILNHFPEKEKDISEALAIIKNNQAIEKSLNLAEKYVFKAKRQLQYLPKNPITANMADLADFINQRNI